MNITLLSALFAAASAVPVFGTVIVPLISVYASLSLHNLDVTIEALNLIWLFVLYVSCEFISTQCFALDFDGSFGVLTTKLIIF